MTLTQAQKEIRKNKIPCSLIGAILGVDKWKTPYQAWMEITGRIEHDKDNHYTEWGHLLEPVVAKKFSEKNNVTLRKNEETLVYDGWLCGTPDYYYDENRGLEIKTTSVYSSDEYGEEHTDEIPLKHALQCYGYMIITGKDVWDLAVLIGGNTYKEYRVISDAKKKEALVAKLKTWHQTYVLGDVEPALMSSDVSTKWPESKPGVCVEAKDGVMDILSRMEQEKKIIEDHTLIYDDLKSSLLLHVGEAETMTFCGEKILTYKSQQRKSLDSSRLKEEMPDVYEKFLKTSSSRVLRIAQKGGK